MSDRGSDGRDARLPDSIDQRLDTCTDHLYGGLIGLVMGFFGAVASIWFVSVALIDRSQPVELLDRAGAAGEPDRSSHCSARRSPAGSTWCRATTAPRSSPPASCSSTSPMATLLRLARRPRRPVPHPRAAEERRRLARRARVDAEPGRSGRRLARAVRAARHQRPALRRHRPGLAPAERLGRGDADVHRGLQLPVAAPARLPAGASGVHGGHHELPRLRGELRAHHRADRRRLVVHQRDDRDRGAQGQRHPPDRARRRHRAGARPRPLLRRDRPERLQAARDHRRPDAGDRGTRALPPRARRHALPRRAAARPEPGRPAAHQRAERLRQELAPEGDRRPLALRRGRGGGSPRARGSSWPRRRPTSPTI